MQARDRSPRLEFLQGSIDNTYIQLAPNVGGLVETENRVDRAINQAPFQYLNVEVHGGDPFAEARAHRAMVQGPVTPYSRYVPRRDIVTRPMTGGTI